MVSSLVDSAVPRPSTGGVASTHQRMSSRSRAQSISSDRPSSTAHSMMSPPLSVSPEAAFIAASAASQIITNDHDSHADAWYDQHGIEPSGEPAVVSPAALQLVNNFLDQLLFNFLAISRSTSLSALRPAVSEVLKPKLAKDAINGADEELREYLGGDDEDAQPQDQTAPYDWDLELVWKRTRLRCMVYSSLGDMEEEDEDYHTEKEHLDSGVNRVSEAVSPAVAIFLTSILEFMGEQALVIAGQASYHRMRSKYEKELKEGARSPVDVTDKVVVEELDMERVALDRTLGRLWRAWKKKIRSPVIGGVDNALIRSFSRDSMRGAFAHLRSPSINAEHPVPATVPEPTAKIEAREVLHEKDEDIEEPIDEYVVAANIPLPLGPDDVEEIEVPGLASYSDDEEEEDDAVEWPTLSRRKSMMIFKAHRPLTPPLSQPSTPVLKTRKRSSSLPLPTVARYGSAKRQRLEQIDIVLTSDAHTDEKAASNDTAIDVTSIDVEADSLTSGAGTPATARSDAADRLKVAEFDTTPVSPVSSEESGLEGDGDVSDIAEDDDEDEIFIEEPQILTSSRISISGRSSSPSTSDHGRPGAINTNLPVRTPSVHSARLIDVTGPRSPIVVSRGSPIDPSEHYRPRSMSRNSGGRTPPIAEDRPLRSPEITSAPRSSGNFGGKLGLAASGIDSEVLSPSPMGNSLAIIPEPMPTEDFEQKWPPRQASTPPSSMKPTTKVTILPSTTNSGTFLIEDSPEPYRRGPVHNRVTSSSSSALSATLPGPPAVPDRSPSRQAFASASDAKQPSTIGLVTIERPRIRTPSESLASISQQRASGSSSSSSPNKAKNARTSEESTPTPADVARNFEQLIHSDQTIQYTLTPESMRDMDTQSLSKRSHTTGSPVLPGKNRKSEEARQLGDRSRSSSSARPSDLSISTSVARTAVAPAYPFPDIQRNSSSYSTISANAGKSVVSASRSAPAIPPKSRSNAPQARDARMPRESVADLADFIRSTGPIGGAVAPAIRAPGPSAVYNPAGPVPVPSTGGGHSSRTSTASNPNRVRLQARDAAVDYRDDNSDLIDFIRRGPPSDTGNPRIPRTVAPFRTTMDSDQMSGAVGGKAVDALIRDVNVRNSQASTSVTEYSMPPSVQSSINSQSALLGRTNAPPSGNSRLGGVDDDMPMPQRKTRRVRDPYAIDLSDEDEEDDDLTPQPKKRAPTQEESLMDFLKNVPPPPEPIVRPQPVTQIAKKKASTPGLMARFTRRDSGVRGQAPGSSAGIGPKSPPRQAVIEPPRNVNNRASTPKGHIPIQISMPPGADKYAPGLGVSRPGGGGMMGGPPPPSGGGGRVQMKRFEPRDAVSVPSRGTSDLADFLMNSEPPPTMAMPSQLVAGQSESNNNSFSKVWGRRKKSGIA
ncbi:hypothetical protein B0T17DRAFT_510582 [Bombardia bombarda]|uniref:Flo11 n=1 Tax=Bombardia bombarda TaxID=252184 RepID=A0AA39WIK2_9PEZI|nr:hypothetical protein B0T17DRAFT_510582 [Bombardia bombarda]